MNAASTADVTEVVATIIAFAGLAVSFWFSWRGQVFQRKQADAAAAAAVESNREAQAAAHRAAVSASLTIDQLTRIADAVAALRAVEPTGAAHPSAALPGGGFEASRAGATVAWRLESIGGDGYRLTNAGRSPAHDVWVGGAASLDGPRASGRGSDAVRATLVGAGASVVFEARILPGTSDSTITVTWAPEPAASARSSWRYPLPAPSAPPIG